MSVEAYRARTQQNCRMKPALWRDIKQFEYLELLLQFSELFGNFPSEEKMDRNCFNIERNETVGP